jgi:hypothetical protein
MPYVVIFEDDAYPCINCKDKLKEVFENISNDIGFILLGWSNHVGSYQKFDDNFNKIESLISGSHSYIIFEKCYDEYLTYIKNNPSTTADCNTFNALKNAFILKTPLFI